MRTHYLLAFSLLGIGIGCEEKKETAADSGVAAAASSTAPVASSVASAALDAAPPEPPHDCPAGSTGIGSFAKPCEAKGKDRMMEAYWKGKYEKDSPQFQVSNKSTKAILYGKMAFYFYDKAGTQIDAKEPIENSEKTHSYHVCSGGNIFSGVMNPNDKFALTFSCMKKTNIPEGTVTIEIEMPIVGYADSTGKKIDFYWRNTDLTPEQRPKGGIK